MRIIVIILISCFGLFEVGQSQSCCSGGVPTSSNLGLAPSDAGQLVLSFGADLNFLNTLKSGSTRLEDDLRNRTTQSYLIRAAYTPTNDLSIEILLPYIIQTRRIITNTGDADKQRTNGIGDVSLLSIYTLLKKELTWRAGVGVSLPTGDFDQRDDRGLFLLEDLQPGSGALDLILYNSLSYKLSKSNPNELLSIRGIYALSGLNENSRNGSQTYQFGDDLQLILNYSNQYFLGGELLTPSIGLRYRNVQRDLVDGFPNSGSGGEFLFVRGGMNWVVGTKSTLYLGGELPVYSEVNETQLAPSLSVNFGWTTTINIRASNESLLSF